jgi:hypothetical protein
MRRLTRDSKKVYKALQYKREELLEIEKVQRGKLNRV